MSKARTGSDGSKTSGSDGLARQLGQIDESLRQAFDQIQQKSQENAELRERLVRVQSSTSYRIARRIARWARPAKGLAGKRKVVKVAPAVVATEPTATATATADDHREVPDRRVPDGAVRISDFQASYDVTSSEQVAFQVEALSYSGTVRSGLLEISFTDEESRLVMPTGTGPTHPQIGEYRYVPDGLSAPEGAEITVDVPPRATAVHLQGRQWKKGETYITGIERIEPHEPQPSAPETLADFIESIPREGRLIIIYSTAPPMGHATLALRPNRLALEYASLGHHVVFLPFGSLGEYPERQGDRIWQIEGSRLGDLLRLTASRVGGLNTFVCSSYPDVRSALAMEGLLARGWSFVYEVRDEMEEFNRVGYSKWFRPQLEAFVARRASSVVTVSPRLAEKMDILRGEATSIVVPNAVDAAFARKVERLRSPSLWSEGSRRTKVGYIGHLTPSWFDWESVVAAAQTHSDVDFEIVGHGAPDYLALPTNITILGPKTHDECAEIVEEWSVGLIPFQRSALTTAVDPNKIYEYLAFGLKTVTMRMGSVEQCPMTWIYDHPSQLGDTLRSALEHRLSAADMIELEEYLAHATWDRRAVAMLDIFGDQGANED